MELIRDIYSLKSWRRRQGFEHNLGFVPTMGALHDGHASLVRQSVQDNPATLVSIFVNPTQFGPNEDLSLYPRDLRADVDLLDRLGVDAVFSPEPQMIYPAGGSQFEIEIRQLDKVLCGRSRPGHMNGVCQVVTILFHLVQPDRAYFGLKDYQQYLILRQLVSELHFPVEIIPCPIFRETDGLAMSSRNRYLDTEQRRQALFLFRTLSQLVVRRERWRDVGEMQSFVRECLEEYPAVELDYFELLHGEDLQPVRDLGRAGSPHAFIAAYLGKTRLIDNMPLYA